MDDKKRDFEDIEFTDESSGKKGRAYRNTNPPARSFREKWKKMKKWKKAVIIIVIVLLLLAVIGFITIWGIYNSGFHKKVDENKLGANDVHAESEIFNVAVFGVDTRDKDAFSGRSDTIMIVSVDRKNKTVKLTSILRDSYVEIEGYKNQKITHAYAFGGAELALNTLNRNFKMDIKNYATINFYKMAEAIDVLGGIDIDITKSEMEQINSEALGGTQKGAALVKNYGHVHLDGDQATIFCRLRKQDSDEARSNRQKMVINALLTQARKVSPTKYAEVVKTIMSLCETSLSFSEVMSFVPMINEEVTIEAITVPGEPENAFGGMYDGAWVWKYDLEQATSRIHMFIYGEEPDMSLFTTTARSSSGKSSASTTSASNNRSNTTTQKSNIIVITGESDQNNSPTQDEQTTVATTAQTEQGETTTQRVEESTTKSSQETTTAASEEPSDSADDAA